MLIKACCDEDYSHELEVLTDIFGHDFNKPQLETQLQLLSCLELNGCNFGSRPHFHDIHKHFCALSSPQVLLLPEAATLIKFVLLMPATNAVSERSASALQRIKTYLRLTVTESKLNNKVLAHIHKHLHL